MFIYQIQNYYLITVYPPNSKRELSRLPYRYNEWDPDFLEFVCSLEKIKPVIFCGDLNVAHKEIPPEANHEGNFEDMGAKKSVTERHAKSIRNRVTDRCAYYFSNDFLRIFFRWLGPAAVNPYVQH